jgi:UV DNA damage endonuclease
VNHPLTEGWNYLEGIRSELKELGDFVKKSNMRVGFHPDHFVVLNSSSKKVLSQSVQTLIYHYKLLKGMGLDPTHRCVLHIGGKKKGKEEGLEQFITNFADLPRVIQRMIVIENDDLSYTVEEALYLGEKLAIPVVFDLHHYQINHQSTELEFLWERVISTWEDSPLTIKMHMSSPKEGELDRSHHDFIDAEILFTFLENIKGSISTLDVMIEAKKKDEALFRLMEDIKAFKTVHVHTEASVTIY